VEADREHACTSKEAVRPSTHVRGSEEKSLKFYNHVFSDADDEDVESHATALNQFQAWVKAEKPWGIAGPGDVSKLFEEFPNV
jgi:hypothetical protein